MYWGRENFIWLVEQMQTAFPAFDVMLMGMPDYAGEIQAIQAAIHENKTTDVSVYSAPPAASLHEFAAMLHECDAVFTPDTSVVHLAAAWKLPTVALFVFNEFGLVHWTPFNTPHRALVVGEEAFLRGENVIRTISRDEVWKALQDILWREFTAGKSTENTSP
jgi:ADP-heptose:LPS heptosyltransferase